MPLAASVFAAGLNKIQMPTSSAEALQGWVDAWSNYISMCMQIATTVASVTAFRGVMAAAFVPGNSPAAFCLQLQAAMTAGLSSAVLIPVYGVTLIPNPAPLGYSPANASTTIAPRMALADKVHLWTSLWMCTGIPPDFTGVGPLL